VNEGWVVNMKLRIRPSFMGKGLDGCNTEIERRVEGATDRFGPVTFQACSPFE
jgi:hypothetical protein